MNERNSHHLIKAVAAVPSLSSSLYTFPGIFYLKKCPESKTFNRQTCEVSARLALAGSPRPPCVH